MGSSLDFDYVEIPSEGDNTLLGVLDRLLEQGVILQGDIRISVAGVDLLEVGLKVMLASIETADRARGHLPANSLLDRRLAGDR